MYRHCKHPCCDAPRIYILHGIQVWGTCGFTAISWFHLCLSLLERGSSLSSFIIDSLIESGTQSLQVNASRSRQGKWFVFTPASLFVQRRTTFGTTVFGRHSIRVIVCLVQGRHDVKNVKELFHGERKQRLPSPSERTLGLVKSCQHLHQHVQTKKN